MEQTHRLGAVVSAAGRSSRMGDFKPLLPVGGLPLLETAIRALQAGGAEQIWVVTGHRLSGGGPGRSITRPTRTPICLPPSGWG